MFIAHQILSTIAMPMFAAFLAFLVMSPNRARWTLTEIPYFPIQIVVALLTAFVIGQFANHYLMRWVWIIPTLILLSSIGLSSLPLPARLDYFFGYGCRPENRCVGQLIFTLPFYSAVSYSMGGRLAGLIRLRKRTAVVQ
jgi:hypothetical protein